MPNKRKLAEDIMVDLLYETAQVLLERIRSGEATPQDISNIIKLLHNNDITVAVKEGEIPDGMLEDLPFQSDLTVVN